MAEQAGLRELDVERLVDAIVTVDAEQAAGEVFAVARSAADPSGYWHRVAAVYSGSEREAAAAPEPTLSLSVRQANYETASAYDDPDWPARSRRYAEEDRDSQYRGCDYET